MTRVAGRHDASPSHAAAGDVRQTAKSAAASQAAPAEKKPAAASRTAVQDKADRYSQSQRPAASSQTADAVRGGGGLHSQPAHAGARAQDRGRASVRRRVAERGPEAHHDARRLGAFHRAPHEDQSPPIFQRPSDTFTTR
jgi:hypothetical protein